MNIVNAVKWALVYKKVSADCFEMYSKLIDSAAKTLDLKDVKSVRFESDRTKVASIRKTAMEITKLPNPTDPDSEVEVIRYAVNIKGKNGAPDRLEKGFRYLFFSDKLPVTFSVRVFDIQKRFEAFKNLVTIDVINEFTYKTVEFCVYKSNESKVERVALFCDGDCEIDLNDLAKSTGYDVDISSALKTSVFCE